MTARLTRTAFPLTLCLVLAVAVAPAADPLAKAPDFDDLVPPAQVQEALLRLDAALLAEVSGRVAAAEKQLGKPRPGLSALQFYEITVRVAGERRSLPVLDQLAADERVKADPRLVTLVAAARRAASGARDTDPALVVALDQISPDQYALFRSYLMQVQDAKAFADKDALDALAEHVEGADELTVAQRKYLTRTIGTTVAALPSKPPAAVLAARQAREEAARQQTAVASAAATPAGSASNGGNGNGPSGEKPTGLAARLTEETAALTDESFEGKIDLVKVGKAWGRGDPVALADYAFLMADAERVLGRPHRHVPAKTLFQASLRLAVGREDPTTVARIEKKLKDERGPEFEGKADVLAMVSASQSLASASRKTRQPFLIAIDKTSPESFRTFRSYMDRIQAATAQRDTGMLNGLAEGLDCVVELDDAQRTYLVRQTAEAREGGSAQPEAVKVLRLLEADSGGTTLPAANAKVLKFCRERVGQKADNGECAMLAVRALEAARAKSFPPSGPEADYVWGRLVQKPSEALPGDVVQFRNVQLSVSRPDGTSQSWSYGHHTAVIYTVDGPGRFTVLQQNVGAAGKNPDKKKIVQVGSLDLAHLKEGRIWIYRPVAR